MNGAGLLRSEELRVFSCALLSRLVLLLFVLLRSGRGATLITEDASLYLYAARGLLWTGGLPLDCFLTPGYPLLLAALLPLAQPPSLAFLALAGLLHAALFALCCLLTFRLAEALFDRATALVAGLLLCLVPDAWPYSMMLMPDVLFACLLVGALLIAVRAVQRAKALLFLAAGLVSGLSVLVKPIGLVIGAALSGLLPLLSPLPGLRSRARACVLGILAFSIFPAAWMARNQLVHGVPSLSLQSGEHLYSFVRANMLADAGLDAAAIAEEEARGGLPEGLAARERALRRIALDDIRAHPGWLLRSIALRHFQLYAGTGTRALLRMLGVAGPGAEVAPGMAAFWRGRPGLLVLQAVSWLVLLSIYALAALGARALLRARSLFPLVLLCGTIILITAQVMNVPHTRYRLFMDPSLCVLAARGLRRLWRAP